MEDFAAVVGVDVRDGWVTVASQLRAEVARLRQEVSRLRRENLELRQQVGFWQTMHARAVERVEQLGQQVQELEAANRQLRQQAFGRKSEKPRRGDAEWLGALEEAPVSPRRRGHPAGQAGPPRRNYQHLPAQTHVIELLPEQRCCPRCGQPYNERDDTEDSEQIEIEVRPYRRVMKRKRYQPQCRCHGPWRIVTAPVPPKLIAKSRLGVSVWVEILLDKFVSQRPTERLLDQWRLLDLDIAAGTVNGGLQRLEPLFTPWYEALIARQQQAGYWQGDETRWRVFVDQEGKIGHQWWLWVFLSSDTVVFVLDVSRSRRVPQEHLPQESKATGVLMVDRLASYKAMSQVQNGTLVLAYCWAHVRRDFIGVGKAWPELKDWALAWLRRIRDLYRLHSERLRARDPADGPADGPAANSANSANSANPALRQHLDIMHEQAAAECAEPTLRPPCRKVLQSLQEHWSGLTRFWDDPRIPLDNNASERQLRGPVVGRKNYYGSGAIWSGRLTAMLFSLFATLERCQINPRLWLTGYLHACANAGGRPPPNLADWLPWQYRPQETPAVP
jgi:transposase